MKKFKTIVLAAASISMVPAAANASLIGYWNLDETSGNIADSSGNGLTGAVQTAGGTWAYNQPTVTAGDYGGLGITSTQAAAFGGSFQGGTDGANRRNFTLGNPTEMSDLISAAGGGTGTMTAMAWVQLDGTSGTQRFITTGPGNGWGFGTFGDELRFTTFGKADNTTAGVDLQVGTWYHIAVTYNNNALEYFVNGASVFTDANAGGYNEETSTDYRIFAATAGNEQFYGSMDELRVYDTVLTQAEIVNAASTPDSPGLSLFAETTAANNGHMVLSSGTSSYNTIPAGSLANIYWDADKDGNFGETAIGENSGNGATTLDFFSTIEDGDVLHFAVDGFTGVNSIGTLSFEITKSDFSQERLSVTEGSPVTFFDSNGDEWQVSFDFNLNVYGNVVSNIGSAAGVGGNLQDHQGVLTFTLVPEPSSLALLGLGGLLLARRRR